MPPTETARQRPEQLTIRLDRVLLVEGQDEVNLFGALIRHCLVDAQKIQLINAGGKDQFPGSIRAIRANVRTRPTVRALGVVRDADDNPDGAFQSVCDNLKNVGFEPPSSPGTFSGGSPSIGVFIVPDGIERGAIETLCRRSVQGSAAADCVDQYLNCLQQHGAMDSKNEDKSFSHAYLAAMRDPLARVGEGARQGVWNFDSKAFAGLTRFLQSFP